MTVHNDEVAAIFEEMADLLEIEEANPFRVRAYRNAARTLRGLTHELSELLARGDDLSKLPGIGKDLASKIAEIIETGSAAALDKLHQEVPASLEALLQIPGLGPKRVKALFRQLEIKDLKQLEQAARGGRLRELDGFGAKTEANILAAIDARRTEERRILYNAAHAQAEPLLAHLEQAPGVGEVVVAGSYRRGRETVGDLDILATAKDGGAVIGHFTAYAEVAEVISHGTTRATVRLHSGLQVDLRVVPRQSLGAALHYFTGSKAHNIQVRRLGQQRGLKINEYGVFKGERRVAGESEASVFKAVGLPLIPPELREGRGELEAARRGELPRLVELGDLRGDLHCHTEATDGNTDIEQMACAAKAFGLEYLAITDHSRRLRMVHGLDVRRLEAQLDEIDQLNARLKGISLLKGIEVDILEDGSLDLPDSVLRKLDLVIGAVHTLFGLSETKQTARILRAMEHKYFSILAHPSGRLLGERAPYALDQARVIEQARQRGCFLELNAQPKRLDLTDGYCQMARDLGVLVAIDSDAHSTEGFDNLAYGINQARRGWLGKQDVLNALPLSKLKRQLKATMG